MVERIIRAIQRCREVFEKLNQGEFGKSKYDPKKTHKKVFIYEASDRDHAKFSATLHNWRPGKGCAIGEVHATLENHPYATRISLECRPFTPSETVTLHQGLRIKIKPKDTEENKLRPLDETELEEEEYFIPDIEGMKKALEKKGYSVREGWKDGSFVLGMGPHMVHDFEQFIIETKDLQQAGRIQITKPNKTKNYQELYQIIAYNPHAEPILSALIPPQSGRELRKGNKRLNP